VRALVLAFALVAGCSEVGPFYCDDDEQCTFEDDDGSPILGDCVDGYFACAYPDQSCATTPMMRFDEDSDDEVAGLCVGDVPPP
jgi:hypothetical protein